MDSFGGLPVKVEHVPHAVHTSTRSGTSTSWQRISILGIEGREDRWSGDSEHGTANERRRHLTAIRELTR